MDFSEYYGHQLSSCEGRVAKLFWIYFVRNAPPSFLSMERLSDLG
jgi:hypothetical protein